MTNYDNVGLDLRTYKNTLSDGSETYDLEVKGSLHYLCGLDKVLSQRYEYALIDWNDENKSIYIEAIDENEAFEIEKDIKDYSIQFIKNNWGF
jgi:hypothetical protein